MKEVRRIYLDHNSTTPMDPRVLEAMTPYFTNKFGNSASRHHSYGWEAEEAVEDARETIAQTLGARTREIVFTSGATEAINLAIKGTCEAYGDIRKRHIVTSVIEHKAVLDTCKKMEKKGWEVTYLPGEIDGRIDPQKVADAIRDQTLLVIIMHANNEIGTINPISEIGSICQKAGVFFFGDAAQSFGKIKLDVQAMGIHLLSASAHKMYGPKGIGCLYLRSRDPKVQIVPLIDGGGHERGFRSGTLPVPLIVGFGKAVQIYNQERDAEYVRVKNLRDGLMKGILDGMPDIRVNGSLEHRLPNNLHVSFPGVNAEALLMELGDEIACSTGSACTSATLEPSHVVRALYESITKDSSNRNDPPGNSREKRDAMVESSVRFAVGRFTTPEEIDGAVRRIIEAVKELKSTGGKRPKSERSMVS